MSLFGAPAENLRAKLDRIRKERDCLQAFRSVVRERALLDVSALDAIDEAVTALINRAVEEARASPPPEPEDVLEDVYVAY